MSKIVQGLLIVLLAAGVVYLYLNPQAPTAAPQAVAVPAAIAPQLRGETKISITPTVPIKVYAPTVKAKLKLPDSVIADTNQSVITASRVRSSDRPQTVTTVFDAATGESKAYVKEEPLPWLAWDTHGEAGMYVGLKNGQSAVRLEVKQGLVQVKAVHFGAIASLDQPLTGPLKADYFVGVGAWYRW